MHTEYVRSLHSNYERILLTEKPEEKRFQYCMISRGGIKGLLPCSLRYINEDSYLYYDITSKQNIVRMFERLTIDREWFLDFMYSVQSLGRELERFLLQESNVLWSPEQIFQDLDKNAFSFVYVPYYKGENSFLSLLAFFIEHIDYEDSLLVECVYKMYEQMELNGDTYLEQNVFEDLKMLSETNENAQRNTPSHSREDKQEWQKESKIITKENEGVPASYCQSTKQEEEQRGFLGRLGAKGKRSKEKEYRENRRNEMMQRIEGYAVAEENEYEQNGGGQTLCLDVVQKPKEITHRLYSKDGKILAPIEGSVLIIGKSKEKVDLYLEDASVSRLHAKIIRKQDDVCLEDLNSTNGTYINAKRLQPYEKRRLEPGDEIMCGQVTLQYR